MTETALVVERLSKAYRIGLKDEIPDTMVGAVTSWIRYPWRNFQRLRRLNTFNETLKSRQREPSETTGCDPESLAAGREPGTAASNANGAALDIGFQTAVDTIWALQDVSFEVKQGEVVGIIGRNGAGKSTLLKVLSRITEPTCGRATIYGRVSSLLEVGTGFHQELSGRENVYMNGTILGMTKREIDRKFDEIVDFSGVEKFLDTPIKHYSSGMKVRLAFAVAAYLEPEILIIDEVLAVGDAAFQQKCVGKMHDVAHSGRTVLFVSHNAGALRSLCQRGILLEGGRCVMDGPLHTVLNAYLDQLSPREAECSLANRTDRHGAGEVRFQSIEIVEAGRRALDHVSIGERVQFIFRLSSIAKSPHCKFRIFDTHGHFVAQCDTRLHSSEDETSTDTDILVCELDELLLMPGRYRLDAALYCYGDTQDQLSAAAHFEVGSGRVRGRPLKEQNQRPIVVLPHRWMYSEPVAGAAEHRVSS